MTDDSSEPLARIGTERRRAERSPAAVPIAVRPVGRHQMQAMLGSISPLGCSVSGVTLRTDGGAVWIRLPGLESQAARVSWSTFGQAGLAFEHPLHPAVANRFRAPAGAATAPPPLPTPRRTVGASLSSTDAVRIRPIDQRRERRVAPPAQAALGFAAAGRPAAILDVSPSGIQVGAELPGGIGSAVSVSFPGSAEIAGTVAWVRGGATGVRLPANALDLFQAA